MKRFSLVLVLVAACSQHRSPTPQSPDFHNDVVVPTDVTWTQLVNATANGNTITKSGGQASVDDAGGVSAQTIGSGNGWLDVTLGDTGAFRFVGLSQPHSGTSGNAIDFAFRVQSGRADVYEMGVWRADNTVVAGDSLRVAVSSGVVTFSKNGAAVFTSATVPRYPLMAAAALIDSGAAVQGARLGADVAQASGTFVSGVTATPAADGTTATVAWTTNVATDGQVQYGATTSYGTWSGYVATSAATHSVVLDALTPGATYHYRVRAQDSGGNAVYSADATFTTPTVGTGPGPGPGPTPDPTPGTTNKHRFCGWLQASGYVPVEQDPSYLAFVAHAADFDAVHPMWYYLTSTTTFTAAYGEGSAMVRNNTTPGGKRTLLIPTIAAADGSGPTWASQMIHDASLRATHEANIVNLVMTKGYDGIDLDYEHLPDADRDAFATFATELAAKLHAKGKTLSFAVGGLITPKYGHWDYEKLSAAADQLHVMGYDFHYLGSHPGPVAPLGWIKQVLAYINTIGGGTRSGKFILGLPNYGLSGNDNGTTTWFGSSMDAINLLGGSYSVTSTHMNACPLTNGDLTMVSGRAPNGNVANGHLFFDDIASHEEKVKAAQAAGLGGITYWTIGGEPDRPGPKTFFEMVRGYFPK
jgi:spore germination protein YaaH